MNLRRRIHALEGQFPADPGEASLTSDEREVAIARLLRRAEGPDANIIEPGQTLTIGERARRVRGLLNSARQRAEHGEWTGDWG